MRQSPHLLDEPPILVYPSLAEIMGINKAVVFQQLHFLLNSTKTAKNHYNYVDNRWWVYNSYAEWKRDYFKWLSVDTIKTIFLELEQKDKFVLSMQGVKNPSDRRKWYTIDYDAWDLAVSLISGKTADASAEKPPMMGGKTADDSSETTSETTSEKDSAAKAAPAKIPPIHVQIIEAYHAALPDDVRPPGKPNIKRNCAAAKRLRDAGKSPPDVHRFVKHTYPTYRKWAAKHGAPELMTLEHVVEYINQFQAKEDRNNAKYESTTQPSAEFEAEQRRIAERFGFNDDEGASRGTAATTLR